VEVSEVVKKTKTVLDKLISANGINNTRRQESNGSVFPMRNIIYQGKNSYQTFRIRDTLKFVNKELVMVKKLQENV
jgi:hypothetical protein